MSFLKLRRITEFLGKNPNPDETTLIVEKEAIFKDNGAITKVPAISPESNMAVDKGKSDAFESVDEDGGLDRMTFFRKINFFLSVNVGVFYVVFFAWILPCRKSFCEDFHKMWEMNFTNGSISSNIAVANLSEQLSVVIYATANHPTDGWDLQALSMKNGERMWNTTINFKPEIVCCQWKGIFFDVNSDEIADCFVAGYGSLIAINASDGHIFWTKNIPEVSGSKMIAVIPESNSTLRSKAVALVFGGNQRKKIQMLVLDGSSGEILKRIDAPCLINEELAFMDRMAPRLNGTGDEEWILVCASPNSTGIWTFSAEKLLLRNENSNNCKFNFLISWKEYAAPKPSDDVTVAFTATQDTLAMVRDNTVTMVTIRPPEVLWKKSFGQSEITHVLSGHFTDAKTMQIAIAERMESNYTIHVMDADNGTIWNSMAIGQWEKITMWKIRSPDNSIDSLLIESQSLLDKQPIQPQTTQGPQRHYLLVEHEKSAKLYDLLTVSRVYDSAFSIGSNGVPSIILASANSQSNSGFVVMKYEMKRSFTKKDVCWE